ncbi:MAG: DNA translocase FtsK [Alphaproteobacteria bacterium]|nr:DNA translocase FtsK [Alphaproteobacteria bacterium]
MTDLQSILSNYGIKGEEVSITRGPLLEIKEFKLAPGSKIKNLLSLKDDIKRELKVSSLDILQHSSNSSVCFEYPLSSFQTVDFSQILNSQDFVNAKDCYSLPICIGVDVYGRPLIKDLVKMPHLLVGGTTGSGKSVGLNTFIMSLISSKTPQELKLVLIDPKKIEFAIYNNQEYLYCPVITEVSEALSILSHLAEEMDKRYDLFGKNLSKNIIEYNQKTAKNMPYIVCVIDEFADLMAQNKKVEDDVKRLAQKARAAGIHLIVATQRPSVDVITGVLKANFSTRISYKVASSADSRTILDGTGAEDLVGRGDLYFRASNGELIRAHGAYIEDDKIISILKPYACAVKPLKLKEETSSYYAQKQETSPKEKTSLFTRFVNFWFKLHQKDRDLIIKGIKYIFTIVVKNIDKTNKKSSKRRK